MGFSQEKIQELYPEAIMYEAMLIHASTDTQLQNACNSGEYFGQLKKDGFWYQFEKHESHMYLFSRTTSKKTGLQSEKLGNATHIGAVLGNFLPPHTILVGEIYYPGGSSKNVTEIMGCLPAKAIERQNGSYGKIHYYIHDILMYDGVDLVKSEVNNYMRYKILKTIFYLHKLNDYDFLELAEIYEDNLYERIGNALDRGEEGMVLKKKSGIYLPGKRPDTNLKAKKVDYIDAVIIGFESPTVFYYGKDIENWEYWILLNEDDLEWNAPIGCHYGKEGNSTDGYYKAVTKPYYMGWNNARIQIGVYDNNGNMVNIGTIHSGISDEMKQSMSENPDMWLGKVCKIQCMEKDCISKTIRHGFYKGLHEEKDAKDCTLSATF